MCPVLCPSKAQFIFHEMSLITLQIQINFMTVGKKGEHFIATHILDLLNKKSFRSNWEIFPWPGKSKADSKPFILLLKPWLESML